jgi:hypothetical protein
MPSTTLAPLSPIVNPLIVIVKFDEGLMRAPYTVIITAVTEVALQTAARPKTLLAPAATVGVTEGVKKLEGYVSVMVPFGKMAVNGVKDTTTGTESLPTRRLEGSILNETDETRDKMLPDDNAFDIEHIFERNLTLTEPVVGGPMVNPPKVMVNADELMTAPEIVITTAVAEVAPHVAVKPTTLLEPEATVGINEDAKKLGGYESVNALPAMMDWDETNARVLETDDLPDTRSEEEISKDEIKKKMRQL